MIAIEPVVTAEKLRQLLDEGHESALLDFKRLVAFEGDHKLAKRDLIELAKDVGAMQADGGYIVIGADDQGNPTGEISHSLEAVRACFDEARLRSQLKKWIPEPFDIRTATHEFEGKLLVLICVAPRDDGFCIFCDDGYHSGTTVFRKGDVFVRHGTASERWQQEDIGRLIGRLVQRQKDRWRAEFRNDLLELGVAAANQQIARGPATSLTWQLDSETFKSIVLELLRADDDIPLRLFIDKAAVDVAELADKEGGAGDIPVVLDRMICLAAIAATHQRLGQVQEAIKGLIRIYSVGFNQQGYSRKLRGLSAPELWLAIIERVMALGALFVRLENWKGVRQLVLRPRQQGEFEHYVSWIRHGLTMAAQSGLFQRTEGDRKIELSLLQLARVHVTENSCLRPDLATEDEEILNSLCQFDFLAGIVAIGDSERVDDRSAFYTSFARFYSHRTDPAIVRLIEDSAMRAELFPYDDNRLAAALREVGKMAGNQSFRFATWDGFEDRRIQTFLRAHPSDEQ